MSDECKRTLGRPTGYSDELADLIIQRFESHPYGLRQLCSMYDDMPNVDTIYSWRSKYDDFSERFLAARKKQAHLLFETSADDIAEIKDYYYDDPKTGARSVDAGIVAAQKAIAQHKLGMAAKIRPKDYGVTSVESNDNSSVTDVSSDVVKEKEKDF
jgi:hypothetical protein